MRRFFIFRPGLALLALLAFALLSALGIVSFSAAAADDSASDLFYKWGQGGHAIEKLPKEITSEAGKLTAFAQYDKHLPANRWLRDAVPLYLINRTDKPITLALQDWHPRLLLEVKVDGRWQRAESFEYSVDGRNRHSVTLAPGTFALFRGHQPAHPDGQAPARYRRLAEDGVELVSNLGQSAYSRADLRAAKVDPVAIRHELPFTALMGLLNGVTAPTTSGWGTQRWGIFRAMGERYPKQTLAMINQWDEARLAKESKHLDHLKRGILRSLESDADDLIYLYQGHPDSRFAQEAYTANPEALKILGQRFPTEAIAFFKTFDKTYPPLAIEQGIQGVSRSTDATLDELVRCMRIARKNNYDTSAISVAMGHRFGMEALAIRMALFDEFGTDISADIELMERASMRRMTADQMVMIVEGKIRMMVMYHSTASTDALIYLAQQRTEEVQVIMERWLASDDASLIFAARELKAIIQHEEAR